MPEYTLKIRRFDPASGEAAYWDQHTLELGERNSVLDAILKIRDEIDGSVGIRCSCQQAICGSCGVRINGKPGLACNTHLEVAAARVHGAGWNPSEDAGTTDGGAGSGDTTPAGLIEVEPMGNMPVIRDLIVDMDAVHWKKIQQVTPYLINKTPIPEREYVVPHQNMVDVTQSMACIQCGACVSDCLSMEVDPLFIGPAALAKAYRFVGDPRDAEHRERLNYLSLDAHGIYDCTHCFNCIDACPKGVAPMSQIMRLRRRAGTDYEIVDRNNGHRHEDAFVTLVRDYGLLNEAELLPRSYGGNSWFGKFHPAAGKELLSSLSTVVTGILRGKVSPKIAMFGHKLGKRDLTSLKRIYGTVEGRGQRDELNLYVSGYEDEAEPARNGAGTRERQGADASEPRGGEEPERQGAEEREPPPEPSVPSGEPEAPVTPPDKSPTYPGPGEDDQTGESESDAGTVPSESENR